MREIKFRAWGGEPARMVYFGLFESPWFPTVGSCEMGPDDQTPIMQYTGLHDNTKWADLSDKEREEWLRGPGQTAENWPGKEIYEGDILRGLIDFGPGGEHECTWKVAIGPLGPSVQGWQWNEGEEYALPEVIGDVHQNPELAP